MCAPTSRFIIGGGTDGFTVNFPPDFVTGTTGVPVGWQAATVTNTSAFYRPIAGNTITVGLAQPPLTVGLFQFATSFPTINYGPTLPVTYQFHTLSGLPQTTHQDVPVRLIPEPASWVLMGLAVPPLLGAAWRMRRGRGAR